MTNGFNWTCPHCQRFVTITNSITSAQTSLYFKNADGRFSAVTEFIVCPNPECNKFTLNLSLFNSAENPMNYEDDLLDLVQKWQLVPTSTAKQFPEYIPKAIINDYTEACMIKESSPKAAATLARRCLQGIIRDFWKVTPSRLVDEIEAIKNKTDHLTWEAIDAVRKIGNIGAHMEKDINLIVDVETNEAELLINLIETLLHDWYVNREERKKRLESIISISGIKSELKKNT